AGTRTIAPLVAGVVVFAAEPRPLLRLEHADVLAGRRPAAALARAAGSRSAGTLALTRAALLLRTALIARKTRRGLLLAAWRLLAAALVALAARAIHRRVVADAVERAQLARFVVVGAGPRLLCARRRAEFVRRLRAALADHRLQREPRLGIAGADQ